jgi:hypothetical protein
MVIISHPSVPEAGGVQVLGVPPRISRRRVRFSRWNGLVDYGTTRALDYNQTWQLQM